MGTVYRLTFENGKSYVGITRGTADVRYRSHAKAAKYQRYKTQALYSAWRKYGPPAMEIIDAVENDELCVAEIRWIKKLNTQAPYGYNVTPGGEMSPALVPSVAAKIGASRMGMTFSDEHRLNLSIAHRGLPSPKRGKPISVQQRIALKEGHARYLLMEESAEVRRKKSEGGKHKLSPEGRAKVSAARKAYWAARKACQGAAADGI